VGINIPLQSSEMGRERVVNLEAGAETYLSYSASGLYVKGYTRQHSLDMNGCAHRGFPIIYT
jgi:hypothetical protein